MCPGSGVSYMFYFGVLHLVPDGRLDWVNSLSLGGPAVLLLLCDHGGGPFLFSVSLNEEGGCLRWWVFPIVQPPH
jgi:hypothetical protein